MKRAKFLGGRSNGKLSATQLVFVLVILVGIHIDEIMGASVAPSISGTTSGTPSMSVSVSTSISTSLSTSITNTISLSFSPSPPVSITNTVTTLLTPTATAGPTITATVGTSGSGTVTTLLTPTATSAPSFTASLSVGASPSPSGAPAPLSGQTVLAYQQYFCGNTVTETQFNELCDFGKANVPKYTCCTKSCHWANGGRKCAKRFNGCWKIGRCTGFGTCRDSTPKPFGVGCSQNTGFCDGLGNCIPNSQLYSYRLHKRGRRAPRKLLKKFLKRHRKFKNFNLAALGGSELFSNTSYLYPDDISDGYLEELERIIEEEQHITTADLDPFDEEEPEEALRLPNPIV